MKVPTKRAQNSTRRISSLSLCKPYRSLTEDWVPHEGRSLGNGQQGQKEGQELVHGGSYCDWLLAVIIKDHVDGLPFPVAIIVDHSPLTTDEHKALAPRGCYRANGTKRTIAFESQSKKNVRDLERTTLAF